MIAIDNATSLPSGPLTPRFTVFPSTVLIDSREQLPYSFAGLLSDAVDGRAPLIVPIQQATLVAGDYSVQPFGDQVAVERKSLQDLYGTLGQGRDRFVRELQRLSQPPYRFAAVVVEAGWDTVLNNPPAFSKLNPKTIFRSVIAWQQQFPTIHWWFVEGRRLAEVTTLRLLERYWRNQQTKPDPKPKSRRGRHVG